MQDLNERNIDLEMYISGNLKFDTFKDIIDTCISICELFESDEIKNNQLICSIEAGDINIDENKICTLKTEYLENNQQNDDSLQEDNKYKELKNIALARLLFGILFKSNPFEGRDTMNKICYSKEEEKNIESKVFVYDTEDTNRPVYGINGYLIKYWSIYPDYIKDKFIDVFEKDIEVNEEQWKKVLHRLKSDIAKKDEKLSNRYKLKIENNNEVIEEIELSINSKIYVKLISDKEIGKVIENKKYKGIMGIKNLTDSEWTVKNKAGETKIIKKENVVVIKDEVKILFKDKIEGFICKFKDINE